MQAWKRFLIIHFHPFFLHIINYCYICDRNKALMPIGYKYIGQNRTRLLKPLTDLFFTPAFVGVSYLKFKYFIFSACEEINTLISLSF